ncbi:MAG: phospho-N-acetylmuramoyl-pentapeptide-transferase [Clostridia bacterium]|nr:phospho-N-acetylmuramoyl-pentapeptide-transferase [Clostridia bacterium]
MVKTYLAAFAVAFGVSLIACFLLIPILRKIKIGQNILSYVKEHTSKSGTPTMGGLAFVFATVLTTVIFAPKMGRTTLICLVIGLSYMAVGLLDDGLKKKRKENLGLRAWQKFVFQALIAVFSGIYCVRAGLTSLNIPFFNLKIDIGGWIIPLAVFVFLATVNAVNLTDGLDGLAAGTSIPFFLTLSLLIVLQNGDSSVIILGIAVSGALFAYLLFNVSPASVFMGDTGSLALGGFAASIAIFSGNALYVAVVGGCFVLSVISVLLQVIYYKATGGKRIFLMAPIHHHFQKKGYSESKIAFAYTVATTILGGVCVWSLL